MNTYLIPDQGALARNDRQKTLLNGRVLAVLLLTMSASPSVQSACVGLGCDGPVCVGLGCDGPVCVGLGCDGPGQPPDQFPPPGQFPNQFPPPDHDPSIQFPGQPPGQFPPPDTVRPTAAQTAGARD
jgi:hypothetical protein